MNSSQFPNVLFVLILITQEDPIHVGNSFIDMLWARYLGVSILSYC